MRDQPFLKVMTEGIRTNGIPARITYSWICKRPTDSPKILTFQYRRRVRVRDGRHGRTVRQLCAWIESRTLQTTQRIWECGPLRLQICRYVSIR